MPVENILSTLYAEVLYNISYCENSQYGFDNRQLTGRIYLQKLIPGPTLAKQSQYSPSLLLDQAIANLCT